MFVVVIMLNMMMFVLLSIIVGSDFISVVIFGSKFSMIRIRLLVMYM